MSWVILAAFAVLAFGALWRFAALPRSALELAGAALLVGIVGYALQGNPAQPGNPVSSREAGTPVDPALITIRQQMTGGYGDSARYLSFSETLIGFGKTREAVIAMRTAIAKEPRNADVWLGLGNALVAHGDGQISPAAVFAFEQAARLSPGHPGPPFFMGMALAQSGRIEDAQKAWQGLLARAPADASWRPELQARLAALAAVSAMAEGVPPTGPATP
ncbi:MAG: tetratricopeptide repeat protein [Sphingomonadaceae bacterium]